MLSLFDKYTRDLFKSNGRYNEVFDPFAIPIQKFSKVSLKNISGENIYDRVLIGEVRRTLLYV